MSITNPEAADSARDALLQQEYTTAAEQEEYVTTKAKLEAKRDQQRDIIDVLGEPVEFRPPGVGVSEKALNLRQRALKGDDEAEGELVSLVLDTLGDHAVDEEMDAEFWGGFDLETVQSVFEQLVMNDLSQQEREQIEQFRGE